MNALLFQLASCLNPFPRRSDLDQNPFFFLMDRNFIKWNMYLTFVLNWSFEWFHKIVNIYCQNINSPTPRSLNSEMIRLARLSVASLS